MQAERAAENVVENGSLLVLAGLSVIVGAITGLVGAIFRLTLQRADEWRNALIAWAHDKPLAGLLVVVACCAGASALAAWLVRRFSPEASGSGIPHVEAVLNEQLPPPSFRLFPVKFIGGVLAIGSGLALGREGPSVQMGASLADLCGQAFRRHWSDCRVLLAAGAGAGLATAFNAPGAGAIFVLEELVRRFEIRIAIAALGASATAIGVARLFLGDAPDFVVSPLAYPSAETRPLFVVLGAVAGLLAIIYNVTLIGTLAAAKRLVRIPVEVRAGLVGAAVGLLAWFAPTVVGGGDSITQGLLTGTGPVAVIPFMLLLRLGLGSVSYAAGTPGGLFAPLLVLGAQLGLLFGFLCQDMFPYLDIDPRAFAIVGMAAFFAGVVRAPLTGIILVVEMTASFPLLLPMLGASFAAMLVPTLLGQAPIYDSLRTPALKGTRMENNSGQPRLLL
jgi:CIC family chloride channel protein